ncbi:MAG: TRAP transporter small permease subunit [Deltaproteobacteria bacterium]|jgi:TRAP-type C4-dicarboxylate transport system permease small subunit|nr:TRAP transporter small permease subunit [Deltaproteobacteria bacterium]
MMKRISFILEKIVDFGGYLSGWLVPLMMILVAVEVFMRYVLYQPLMVADEFSAYLLVALSYLGMAYTWKQGGHVRINLLVNRLPARVSGWIRLMALILVLIFLIGLDQAGYKMIMYALKINLRSETWLTFPLFWPQLTIFIGFLLLTLLLVVEVARTITKIRAGENVEEATKWV